MSAGEMRRSWVHQSKGGNAPLHPPENSYDQWKVGNAEDPAGARPTGWQMCGGPVFAAAKKYDLKPVPGENAGRLDGDQQLQQRD
jgi:hypothetical protein